MSSWIAPSVAVADPLSLHEHNREAATDLVMGLQGGGGRNVRTLRLVI